MSNLDSQRWAETEVIELIANLIASYSHHNELYNSIQVEIAAAMDKWEDTDALIEEGEWHYKKMSELLEERRNAMRLLKEMWVNVDEHMWCLVKHSIACYQFSQELLNTNMNNFDYMWLAERAYQYMYECISKFLWVELVTCARCLSDALKESKPE